MQASPNVLGVGGGGGREATMYVFCWANTYVLKFLSHPISSSHPIDTSTSCLHAKCDDNLDLHYIYYGANVYVNIVYVTFPLKLYIYCSVDVTYMYMYITPHLKIHPITNYCTV